MKHINKFAINYGGLLGDARFYIDFFMVLSLHFGHSSTMTTCQVGSIYNCTTLQRCQIWPVYFQNTLDKVDQLKFFELQLNTDYSWSPLKYKNLALSTKFWYLERLQLHIGIFKKWPTLATLQYWGRGLIHWLAPNMSLIYKSKLSITEYINMLCDPKNRLGCQKLCAKIHQWSDTSFKSY